LHKTFAPTSTLSAFEVSAHASPEVPRQTTVVVSNFHLQLSITIGHPL